MKNAAKRIFSALLCLTILAGFLPGTAPTKAEARNYGVYEDVGYVYDQGSCPSMQGMSVHGSYVYACKINGSTDASAVVARLPKSGGSATYLTNASTGTIYFSDFGHGNDIEVETIAGVTTLFVPTSKSGSGSLVRYKISGTTATKVGSYNMVSTSGSSLSGGAIRVIHYDDTNITFLFKSGKYCYTGTLPISQTSGNIVMTSLCTLDYSSCYVNGTYKDTSSYSLQGMGYYDHKLYLPLSGHTVSGHENISIILVYDLEGASGTIEPDPDLTFQITSSYYGALFEVESCEISPQDNRMYFSTNRRRTSSDTNHDGVSYISNWTYDPSARNTDNNNYRWEVIDDELVSVTDGGNVYNGVHMLEGKITDGTFQDARFSLSENVVLKQDQPWVVEWRSSGSGSGSLLLATQSHSAYSGQPFIFRNGSGSMIAIGSHDGSQYNNYGVDLTDHGIDADAVHTYRLTNKLEADGTNMVYLSVDGKELGPMTTYFINGTKQSSTGTWVSGQDFKFSYLGTGSHKIDNCNLEYLQIWATGLGSAGDEPNTYRWESGMTSVSDYGINVNTATLVSGTTSGIDYTDCRYDLAEEIVLMHDRPWVLEWDNAGTWSGGLLLAADHMSCTYKAPYLFRSGSIIAIGYHDGSRHVQWGVKLADHGIDINGAHTYTLRNLISDDGSNMIWLYVDGTKIAPLTTYCTNGSATSTTSEYLAGHDFVFSHMGTFQHDVTGGMAYMQVWEGGKPEEYEASNYRWETQNDQMVSIVNDTFEENSITPIKGTCTESVYTDTQLMLQKSIVLLHDRHWQLQWEAEGAWSGGGLFLSSAYSSYTANNIYIFRNSNIIALGQYTDSQHQQWGFRPSDYGIDHSQKHTYTLANKVNADGSNMIYMYVDGVEIAPMAACAVNGSVTGETSEYLSGKDFVFNFLGTTEHPIQDTAITYLQVYESCMHTYSSWTETQAATCTADGSRTRSCTICGEADTEVLPATGHNYNMTTTESTCSEYAKYHFACGTCGDSYTLDAGELASGWIDYIPAGMDASQFNSKTQYRYSDYETTTSYETSLDGYTLKSSEWEQSGTGSVSYVNSWPSGFSTSSSLYTQYNHKSSKVSASETETAKTVVNSDQVVGYLYYHWCYSDSYYSKAAQEGSYTTFHAYYSTTAPSNYDCDTSDMSYNTAHSTCSNSTWFFVTDVYQQSYTQYKKLFTYERWTDFSDWADTAATASDTRKVETRTVYQLKEASLGSHSYTSQVIAPTCSAQGYTLHTCTTCGDSYQDTYTSMESHSYTAKVTTAATCEQAGVRTYTCGGCGDSYTETIAATGHSFDGGYCTICGAVDPDYDTAVTVPTLKPSFPTLTFEDVITMNVYFTAGDVTDVVEMGLITYSGSVADYSVETAENVIPGYRYSDTYQMHVVSTEGIAAKNMSDEIFFSVYAKLADGTYTYSALLSYSPTNYAYTLLDTADDSLKQLMVAMLNYGAEAQTFFSYRTDALMNANLTADQQSSVESYRADMMDSVSAVDAAKAANFTRTASGFTSRYPSISFEGAFQINYYCVPSATVSGNITLYYWTQADFDAASVLSADNATGAIAMTAGTDRYEAAVTGIAAKDLDKGIYVAFVYTDGTETYCSGILGYSIGAYCVDQAATGAAISPFAEATAVYGYYAKEYFYK